MKNILTAIFGKFANSDLSSYVGGRIYLDQAPESCEFPYVVYFVVSSTPDDVFAKKGQQTLIQFSLFSANPSAVEISTMHGYLKALFDDCSLTITSNTLFWMHEVNLTTMVDEITVAEGVQSVKAWHADYEVVTQVT
jgi:hypothetical protein